MGKFNVNGMAISVFKNSQYFFHFLQKICPLHKAFKIYNKIVAAKISAEGSCRLDKVLFDDGDHPAEHRVFLPVRF